MEFKPNKIITLKLVSILSFILLINSRPALSQKINTFMISAQGELAVTSKIKWYLRTGFDDSHYIKEYTGQVTRIGLWWLRRISNNKQTGLFYSPSLLHLHDKLNQKPAQLSSTHKLDFHITKNHAHDTSSWIGSYTRFYIGLNHIIMRNVNGFYSGYTTLHTTDLNGTGYNLGLEHGFSFYNELEEIPLKISINYGFERYDLDQFRIRKNNEKLLSFGNYKYVYLGLLFSWTFF